MTGIPFHRRISLKSRISRWTTMWYFYSIYVGFKFSWYWHSSLWCYM